MTDSKRIIKNTMYLYIKTGFTIFIVLYTTRLIFRSLGETDFGIFNIVGGVISMLGFLNTAMAVTIQRFLNYEQGKGGDEKQKKIFNVGVVFHVIIAVIISLMLIVVAYFLFDSILNIPKDRVFAAKVIYGCLIVSTVFTIITVPYDACMNAHENMLYYSIVGIIEAILKLVVAFIVVYSSQDKLILYGILMGIIPIISMSLMRIYCHTKYDECKVSIKKYYDKGIAKEMFSFAGWSLLGSSSNYIGNYGNMIVMNHYFGAALNAVMGIANQIQGQLMVLSTGMLKALNPVIAKEEGAGNSGRMLAYSLNGCEFSYFLLAVFSIPFIVDTPIILNFWLGDFPEWTILFVRLQLIRALLEQVTVSLNKSLEAKNKIKIYNLIVFIFNLIPMPILCILYSIGYQPYWYYVITIISMVIVPTVVKIFLCCKYCEMTLQLFLKSVTVPILLSTIASLLTCWGVTIVIPDGIIRLCLEILFTFTILAFVGYCGLIKSQKEYIKSFAIIFFKK